MEELTMQLPKNVSFEVSTHVDRCCPNCSSRGLNSFYSLKDIPVHSCLLMSSKEDARDFPTGDLELGFCPNCGFITNSLFNPDLHNYSGQCEETQGFSACFNAFAKSLAARTIDKYDIRNKVVLEIGCGKGEFLALMCRLGDNLGIGFDPAYVPERNPDENESRIEFVQDFYSAKYAGMKADVICCRHTLEHIAPTLEFMRMIHDAVADRPETLLFFELPDVMRVLREGAFWDIYYEHCTYFTAGSLARLFRMSGFDPDELYLDYHDQYLIVSARPNHGRQGVLLDLEDDMEQVSQAVDEFGQVCSQKIDYWLRTIREFVRDGKKFVLWGSGSKAVAFLTTLGLTDEVEYVVDINPYRHGKRLPGTGHEIVAPNFLKQYKPRKVIVMNPIYCDEIQQELNRLGVTADLLACE